MQVWKNSEEGFSTVSFCVYSMSQRCWWAKSWCIRTLGGFRWMLWGRSVRKLPSSHSTTATKHWYSNCICTQADAHKSLEHCVLRWEHGIKISNWKCSVKHAHLLQEVGSTKHHGWLNCFDVYMRFVFWKALIWLNAHRSSIGRHHYKSLRSWYFAWQWGGFFNNHILWYSRKYHWLRECLRIIFRI